MVSKKENRAMDDFVKDLQSANKSVTHEQALLIYGTIDAAAKLLRVPQGERITINRSR